MKNSITAYCTRVTLATLLGLACAMADGEKTSNRAEDAIPVTVARVTLVPVDKTISVVGTLFPKDDATLSAQVEGQVEKTMAEFGDRLTNGQVIAQIDTTTYDAQARQAAANLARAQATAANTEQNLKRVQELRTASIASPSDLDKAVADAAQARADVKSAEATEAIARLNRERSIVRAPFDCAVGDRLATVGDFMKVGSPLFRVVNDRVLKYIVNAPERYAGDVKKEQLVLFNVDAYPGEQFEGRVYLISPTVNTATRAFAFGALVQNPDSRLRASSFARGELIIERNVPTPFVPLDAIINFAGVTKVFVVDQEIARSRNVQVGRIRDGRQEILAGLKVGETVITTGQTKLFDGTKVRVKKEAANPASGITRQ